MIPFFFIPSCPHFFSLSLAIVPLFASFIDSIFETIDICFASFPFLLIIYMIIFCVRRIEFI